MAVQPLKGQRTGGITRQAEDGSQWFAGAGDRRKEEELAAGRFAPCPAKLILFCSYRVRTMGDCPHWYGDGGNVYTRSSRSSLSQEQRLRELVAEGLEKSNKVKLGDGYLVRIPEIKGRICRIKRGSSTYVEYIYTTST